MTATDRPRPTSPRIAPRTALPPELDDVMGKALAGPSGAPLNIFGTLAHNPGLLKRFNVFGGFFLNKGVLPAREREIVILRVGWNARAVYEFGQHTVIGERCGITADEVRALTWSPAAHPWSDDDRNLIALADDLCADDCVSDATWKALQQRWDEAALVELVCVAGMYRLVSGFLNTMGVQLDDGVPGWPEGAGTR